jgi:hypothetical protein
MTSLVAPAAGMLERPRPGHRPALGPGWPFGPLGWALIGTMTDTYILIVMFVIYLKADFAHAHRSNV